MSRRKKFESAYREAYQDKPSDIRAQNTVRTDYYRKTLWRLFLGSFEDEVPNNWSIDYFRFALFYGGSVAVTKYNGVVVPFTYSIVTRNDWEYPVKIQSFGKVQLGERTVGVDAELIYLGSVFDSLWSPLGVNDIINVFAQRLANCDASIDINLLNSRTPFIFGARDSADEKNLKMLYTKMMNGEPAVFYRYKDTALETSPGLPVITMPAKTNYIANDIQTAKMAIYNEFLTLIGVKSANTLKRERLITDEVNSVDGQLECATNLWQRNVNRCIKNVKNMFGEYAEPLYVKFREVNDEQSGLMGIIRDNQQE